MTTSTQTTTTQPVLQIVLTMGQSLAVGTTATHQVYNPTPMYASNVLGMNFGSAAPMNVGWQTTTVDPTTFQGFAPLVETVTETHVSGMLDALVSDYKAAGLTSPDFLNINASVGGYSIVQLMTSSSDVFKSVAAGLLATTDGTMFAVPDRLAGYYTYHMNVNGTDLSYGLFNGAPGNWDNMVQELTLAVQYAQANGFQIAPSVVFNWMQGGADRAMTEGTYQSLLDHLINAVDTQVQSLLGTSESTLTVVDPIRDAQGSPVATDQLQEILDRPDVIYGASDFQFEMEYPSHPFGAGQDFIHTQAQGYFAYGQTIGHKIFSALQGHEDTPIVMDQVTETSPTHVVVHFSGVDTYLVSDASIYSASNGLKAPSNMGFYAYDAAGSAPTSFAVTNAVITGPDTVELDFSAPITSSFRLYLGRSEDDNQIVGGLQEFGGTTLRDAATVTSLKATNGRTPTDTHLYDFAPDQYYTVTPTSSTPTPPPATPPQLLNPLIQHVAENTTLVTDLQVTDSTSTEGNGIVYAITGGTDAAAFTIDPVSGVINFTAAPNFEAPGSAAGTNTYDLMVSVLDGAGLTSTYDLGIVVDNVNEAPTNLTTSGLTTTDIAAAGTIVGTVSATDPDAGDKLTYALANTYNGAFALDPVTGKLTVASTSALAALSGQTVGLAVTATDTGGLGTSGTLPASVTKTAFITYFGTSGNDTYVASGTAPAYVDGGAGDDTITGTKYADSLHGGVGNDLLIGLAGGDILDGGAGFDTASFAASTAAVSVNLLLGTGTGGYAQGDTLIGIEKLIGSAYNDTLIGDNNDDTLQGGLGNDILNGMGGINTADYSDSHSAVTVSLALTAAQNTKGDGTDTLISIQNLIGSAYNDVLTGDANANVLTGGAGNDWLDGGAGADTLVGGAGNDTYVVDNAGDIVDETNGSGGDAGGVDLVNASVSFALTGTAQFVENLTLTGTANINATGNDLNNVLTGNAGDNVLDGGKGNDTLVGNAGNDTLIGGDGNDALNGGTGDDVMIGGAGNDTYTVDSVNDVVDETNGSGGDAGGVDLVNASVSFSNT